MELFFLYFISLHNQLVSILIFMCLILRDRSLDTITRIEPHEAEGAAVVPSTVVEPEAAETTEDI